MFCLQANNSIRNSDNRRPVPSEKILPADAAPHSPSRQVVTMAFLSERLPASLIGERLARSLCEETNSSVVLVRFERQDGRGKTKNGMAPA